MRDKKDNATFDLPGFEAAAPSETAHVEQKRRAPRARKATPKHEQLLLLEETDVSGLPVWRRDDNLDLTGLPIWAPA
jgi:predicted RNA-binding Zn ribbon-like protein